MYYRENTMGTQLDWQHGNGTMQIASPVVTTLLPFQTKLCKRKDGKKFTATSWVSASSVLHPVTPC